MNKELQDLITRLVKLVKYINTSGFNLNDDGWLSARCYQNTLNINTITGEVKSYTYEESYHNGDHHNCKYSILIDQEKIVSLQGLENMLKIMALKKARERAVDKLAKAEIEALLK